MALATVGAFAGGVLSTAFLTHFYCKPTLFNKEGVKILGLGGFQGMIFAVAAYNIAEAVGDYTESKSKSKGTKDKKEQNGTVAALTTYALCGLLITVIAKTLTHRLGTPKEAFINFAVSSALGALGLID